MSELEDRVGTYSALGIRMKEYEAVTTYYLPRRTHVILRLDGKAFHSYTKDLDKPYDTGLRDAMAVASFNVMKNIAGSVFAYIQSDEASILVTDYRTIDTNAAFNNSISKLVSVSASVMTAHFNKEMLAYSKRDSLAYFDSRAFCIPDVVEVYNYFVWRQRDCITNSIQSLAQKYFSHSELQGLNGKELQYKLLTERDVNWSIEPNEFKNGTIILPTAEVIPITDSFTKTELIKGLIPVRED